MAQVNNIHMTQMVYTPIKSFKNTDDSARRYHTIIHIDGQALLDGWYAIYGFRGVLLQY